MKAWVFAQMTFDASRNATALMEEFIDGFYSTEAAPLGKLTHSLPLLACCDGRHGSMLTREATVWRHMHAFSEAVLDMPAPPDDGQR